MAPTAHPQLAVRVFVEEQTSLTLAEVNSSFKLIEEGHNDIRNVDLGEIDITWSARRENGGTFIKGFDVVFEDNNTVPFLVISGIVDTIDDFIANDNPIEDDFVVDILSSGTNTEERIIRDDESTDMIKDDESSEAREFLETISIEDDVLYSCTAKGDFANFDRPLFNEFIGVGSFAANAKEDIKSKSADVIQSTDFPLTFDTVESELYRPPAFFLNTQNNTMTGGKADTIMDLLNNMPSLALVGKISRTD